MSKSKKKLIGRDPTKGLLSFKTGIHKTRKDRIKNRKDKYARKWKERQLEDQ